jgi:hypothetical protein
MSAYTAARSIQTERGTAAAVSTDSRRARSAVSPERFGKLRELVIDGGCLLLAVGILFLVLSFPLVVGLLVRGILGS